MTSLVQEEKWRNNYESVSKDADSCGRHQGQFRDTDTDRPTVNNRRAYDSGGRGVALWQNQKTFGFYTKKTRSSRDCEDELSLFATDLPAEVFPEVLHGIGVVEALALE